MVLALFNLSTKKTKMKSIFNTLPGGPAVNQLNLHRPVTKIAEEQPGCTG
jgi:hypothetical protein